MFVVSVCSLKGGVGKTSLVLGLADAALTRELATLVVDLDPQGDATYGLGVDADGVEGSSGDVLERPKRRVLEKSVVASPWASGDQVLHVLPAGSTTAALDRPDAEGEQLHTLRRALGKLEYDLVLVDAPPSLSGLTRSALVASDRALIVAEPGAFAVNAANRLLGAIEDLRRREAGWLQPLGIVVNRYRPGVSEHRAQLEVLERTFGPLVLRPPLPDRAVIQKAQGQRAGLSRTAGSAPTAELFAGLLARIERAAARRR